MRLLLRRPSSPGLNPRGTSGSSNQLINRSVNQTAAQGTIEPMNPPTSRSCRRAVTVLPMVATTFDSPNDSTGCFLHQGRGSPFSWVPAQFVRYALSLTSSTSTRKLCFLPPACCNVMSTPVMACHYRVSTDNRGPTPFTPAPDTMETRVCCQSRTSSEATHSLSVMAT